MFLQDLNLREARGGSALALLTLITSGVVLGLITLLLRKRGGKADTAASIF